MEAGKMTLDTGARSKAVDRWRMSRAGLLNFWHYDEEVFELEEGRLILRGANGSGKSVTMQSFLPLVLDGDKRSHRLDPFGSRDRRIEYYLLGEADSGKTDVTGYLWMEFAHETKGLTKTIGIGLRARRGANQVQFWGFLLDDGRRIGKDFWLYDRKEWFEHQVRTPYGRQDLEKAIGSGGQVVQDQSSYRDMVNKQVFGFADTEAFSDLLHLMIQLRSPKLSKDFKPSAIYEILHGALPPLQDDDLRPLSEVLEDMDQIADRLDELRLHKREMEKLQGAYDRYNKRTLYDLSVQVLERNAEYCEMRRRTSEYEAKLAEAETLKEAAAVKISELDAAMQEAAAELEILGNHEAIGKQRELESAVTALEETGKHLKLAEDRIEKHRSKLSAIQRDLGDLETKQLLYDSEQDEAMGQLEQLSGVIEFAEHSVYQRNWNRNGLDNEDRKEPWKRDLRLHRERLEKAATKAREEREAAGQVEQLEIALGEARKERDGREREKGECERALEASKEELKEAILRWRGTLQELPFEDDVLRSVFEAVTAFGPDARSAQSIREPVGSALGTAKEQLGSAKLRLQHEKNELVKKRDHLREEKRMWEESREPEPERSVARMKRRSAYPTGSGAPLYAVCDFQEHIGEEQRARIEEALERSGLLDAWIAPDGRIGAVHEGQEEMWIVPQPHEIGYTLADVLRPAPSVESRLREETIDAILRTFLWVDEGDVDGYDALGAVLSGSGLFRLGPLAGAAAAKDRAQYIGKETRKRTRMLEIARLQQEIEQLAEEIAEVDNALAAIAERESLLLREAAAFPSCDDLESALKRLLEATYRLDAARGQEERTSERFKVRSSEWRELQRQLHELTADWTRLKREKELLEAVSMTKDYETSIGDLFSAWSRSRDAASRIERLREDEASERETLEHDEGLIEELEESKRRLRSQIEALRRLMDELGLADISRRIEELRTKGRELQGEKKNAVGELDKAKELAFQAGARLQNYQEREAELEGYLESAVSQWERDLRRNFVEEWKDLVPERGNREGSVRLSARIKQSYDAQFASKHADSLKNSLLEQFNTVRSILTEYVLEMEIEEDTGRIIIQSKRDRSNPLPPFALVEELTREEAHQSALLSEKDRELYEEIILRSVGKAIRQRIHRAESWVKQMNRLMEDRNTSSGLRLKLDWEPKAAQHELQMDTISLVELLKRDSHRLRDDEIDAMINHFRYQIGYAKQTAQTEKESLRKHLYEVLDYRNWFQFELKYKKGEQAGYRPLTDSRFNVLSGGEKAMAMYIPLFAAAWSRYSDARADAPRLISLDEAFAGVDEENMKDMFGLLSEMGFDYMMTSQVLWGCYDTVPKLAIYEIHRPKDADFVTTFHYRWNGRYKELVVSEDDAS